MSSINVIFYRQIQHYTYIPVMSIQVDRPNLNRGLNAAGGKQGTHQPSMGNFRGSNFKFPSGLAKSQPNGNMESQPRKTYSYNAYPPELGEDAKWDTGTLYFMKKTDQPLVEMYDLGMTRSFIHTSHAVKFAGLNNDQSGTKNLRRTNRRDHTFMSDFDRIVKELEFAGVGIGKDDPSETMGDVVSSDRAMFSGNFKVVPLVFYGFTTMSNYWEQDLLAGQSLYAMIKPLTPEKTYLNSVGEVQTIGELSKYETIPDIVFTTNQTNSAPRRLACLEELYNRSGQQPDLHSRSWIDWKFDTRTERQEIYGEVKDGMVWCLGKSQHGEEMSPGQRQHSRNKTNQRLRFMQDYNTMPHTIEVLINPRREF